ncbi:MAG TPA: hypothetical protein VF553_09760 [Pyrinomonadaceae bacterium]|jgi:hypothetical protein
MNRSIKIIKSAQRAVESRVAEVKAQPQREPSSHPNREMASRVGAWVKEFKQRRVADPRRAFASLFAEPTPVLNQPS